MIKWLADKWNHRVVYPERTPAVPPPDPTGEKRRAAIVYDLPAQIAPRAIAEQSLSWDEWRLIAERKRPWYASGPTNLRRGDAVLLTAKRPERCAPEIAGDCVAGREDRAASQRQWVLATGGHDDGKARILAWIVDATPLSPQGGVIVTVELAWLLAIPK